MEIRPQAGKQEEFLSTNADICLYGGSAGSGKSFALLLEALRHKNNAGFGAVIFRKEHTQITNTGGLWDEAIELYTHFDCEPSIGNTKFTFSSGATVTLRGLGADKDLEKWQGSQIAYIGFDELTHFSKKQFMYMLSRNRSTCGVKPYIRATTNPDADSWVRDFIDWWIGEDGLPIPDRSGVIRYFVNYNDVIHWSDNKEDLKKEFPGIEPKSFTFISASVYDNKKLLEKDPSYLANLQALPKVDRERLLYGNWNTRADAGQYFKKRYFEIVETLPPMRKTVRSWDFAGTKPTPENPDPDYTVGLLAGLGKDGYIYIIDIVRLRDTQAVIDSTFKNTGTRDGKKTNITVPKDVGSAGKALAEHFVRMMLGYPIKAISVTGSKEVRAKPASSQAEQGNIKLLRGDWNEEFLNELEKFPLGKHDDQVDALSDAIEELSNVTTTWDY